MGSLLANYSYTYGVGEENNRRIQFFRTNNSDSKTIYAKILARLGEDWVDNGYVQGDQISVEMMSTSDKMQEMMKARQSFRDINYLPNRALTDLPIDDQNKVLRELNRSSGRRIEIINDIGGYGGLEKVVKLNIFDPR